MRAGRPSPLRSPVRLRILSLRAREATSRQAPWSFQRAACANELYVVVFVTGVMISPSVIRVAALVPDPTQQIKDGATYEMNELVFSPRCQYCVTLPH